MSCQKSYYIYIMASISDVFYIGVTNELLKRYKEHKEGINQKSFTSKYKCFKLVYFEEYQDIKEAIAREKQLKRWKRLWKINLIKKINPSFEDLVVKFLS